MKRASIAASAAFSIFTLMAGSALASGEHPQSAIDHAPIGVMGDHYHKAGEVMFSYRFMRMSMEGNRIGTDEVPPEQIATTVPNRFFGRPMQPPTLRVVPLDMTMDMHMFGAMYAPTDWLTLMAMGMYVTKEMDHLTFQGGMGTTVLGEFTTESKGLGDTSLAALFRIFEIPGHKVHFQAGIGLPTGSIGERDQILTPMGGTPTPRLPYPMQLGSGSYELLPAATYVAGENDWRIGAQYRATLRITDSAADYRLGDAHQATAWVSYGPAPWIGVSGRATAKTQGRISGIDALIAAPVQTANPDNFGGDRIDLGVGVNLMGQTGPIKGHRLGVEFNVPVYQDLNGPQMETDWSLTVGWQKAF